MIKKKLIFTVVLLLTSVLVLMLAGCSKAEDELEGKNIVTFEINGGTFNYGTSSTKDKVNYAYHPGTYIIDPSTINNYSLTRSGYVFKGWYTSKDCKPEEKWDFTQPFNVESLVLYAGWEKAIKYSYSLYYTEGEDTVSLGAYDVKAGDRFSDWQRMAESRKGYTVVGYFSDKECLTVWNNSSTHPGGDSDLDVPVYVKYIEGDWQIASSYDTFVRALSKGNVYLTADIDCGGKEISMEDFNHVFEGNGYTVSNFTVKKGRSTVNPPVSIFESLGAKADVRNVRFENVSFDFLGIKSDTETVKVNPYVAALTVEMAKGAKVSNVSVSGSLITNYTGELPCLNSVYYYKDAPDAEIMAGVTDFVANIVIDRQ